MSSDSHKHEFIVLTKTTQSVDFMTKIVLEHSTQVLVCKTCGKSVNPWRSR